MSKLPSIQHPNLRPCPRCNSNALIQQHWVHGHANLRHYKPVCSVCKFTPNPNEEYRTLTKAIKKWNSTEEQI